MFFSSLKWDPKTEIKTIGLFYKKSSFTGAFLIFYGIKVLFIIAQELVQYVQELVQYVQELTYY